MSIGVRMLPIDSMTDRTVFFPLCHYIKILTVPFARHCEQESPQDVSYYVLITNMSFERIEYKRALLLSCQEGGTIHSAPVQPRLTKRRR